MDDEEALKEENSDHNSGIGMIPESKKRGSQELESEDEVKGLDLLQLKRPKTAAIDEESLEHDDFEFDSDD